MTGAILEAGGSSVEEAKIVSDHREAHLKGHEPRHRHDPRYYEALHRDELRPNKTVSVVATAS